MNSSLISELHEVFARRDADRLREILAENREVVAHIHQPYFGFDSPAIVAYANDAAMVDVLLDFGADPNQRSSWWAGGFHPLHVAQGEAAERLLARGATMDACAAASLDRIDALRALLADDPSRVHERGGDGQFPLHFARSRDVIDLLLSKGADIDAIDIDHRSPAAAWMLDRAAGAGRYALAQYLVERGASVDIILAAALGLTERARAMVQADRSLLSLRTGRGAYGPEGKSSFHIYFWTIGAGRSPLQVARQFGHVDAVDALLALAPDDEALLFAVTSGDAERARAIAGAHPKLIVSMSDSQQRTIADMAGEGNLRAVELCVELGFDLRTPGHDGGSALHWAAFEGSPEITRALLAHPGATSVLTMRDANHGGTPLGWCCYGSLHGDRRRAHDEVARLLRDAGAPIEPDLQASPAVLAALRGP